MKGAAKLPALQIQIYLSSAFAIPEGQEGEMKVRLCLAVDERECLISRHLNLPALPFKLLGQRDAVWR